MKPIDNKGRPRRKPPNFKPSFRQAATDAHDWLREYKIDCEVSTIESELIYITDGRLRLLDRSTFGAYMINWFDSRDEDEYELGLDRLRLKTAPIKRTAKRSDSVKKIIEKWFAWTDEADVQFSIEPP